MKIVYNRILPWQGFSCINLFGILFVRKGCVLDERVLNHERIHTAQAKVCGSWVKFYLFYLWEWLRIGFMSPLKANYYTSKYESEAYANEDDYDYCDGYDGSNLSKYVFKNRKKLYKDVGRSAAAWKRYVKSL